jgi:hypothetical protein
MTTGLEDVACPGCGRKRESADWARRGWYIVWQDGRAWAVVNPSGLEYDRWTCACGYQVESQRPLALFLDALATAKAEEESHLRPRRGAAEPD